MDITFDFVDDIRMGELIKFAASAQFQKVCDRSLHAICKPVPANGIRNSDGNGDLRGHNFGTLYQNVSIRLPNSLTSNPTQPQKLFRCTTGLRCHDYIYSSLSSWVLVVDDDIENAGNGFTYIDIGVMDGDYR